MTAAEHLPVLIVTVPLLAAFAVNIAGLFKKELCQPIAALGLGFAFAASVAVLLRAVGEGEIHYRLGGWMPQPDGLEIGIEYVVDTLNAMVLVLVSFTAFILSIFTKRSVENELPGKATNFYTLFSLFATGLLGITVTGDAFNLYVLLEITALTSYSLVAAGRDRAPLSSFNYLIMGTIGASFYLLGVGHLYITTGLLNMPDLRQALSSLYESNAVQAAFVLILVGVWVKMAFFPLHGWLPNAYTHAPSASACVMAPLMTKVSVYVMIRVMFSIFTAKFAFQSFALHGPVVWMAVAAIVGGSLLALAQSELKRMLTYLIVAEVGYMVGGAWLANQNGLTGAILHILNDGLMTMCLFMVAAVLAYKIKGNRIADMKGLFRKMPFTMAAFTVGALSMIGVPPTCGFFSKWYLLLGAVEAGAWGYLAALVFSSLINIVLFFRVIEIAFFEAAHEAAHGAAHEAAHGAAHGGENAGSRFDEAPFSMLAPLLLVAAVLIAVGLGSGAIVEHVIRPFVVTVF